MAAVAGHSLLAIQLICALVYCCGRCCISSAPENVYRYAEQHYARNWVNRIDEIRLSSNRKGVTFVYLPHEVILMKQAVSKEEQMKLFSHVVPSIPAKRRQTDQSLCGKDECILFTSTMKEQKEDEMLQRLGSDLFLETAEQLVNIQKLKPSPTDQNLYLQFKKTPRFAAVHGVWYNENGYLRSHRDRTWDNANKTSQTEWVLSISLGATARFSYHHPNDEMKRNQSTAVLVESGDVLLFNGAYLHHGVQVLERSTPYWWKRHFGNFQGRLNLQYRVQTSRPRQPEKPTFKYTVGNTSSPKTMAKGQLIQRKEKGLEGPECILPPYLPQDKRWLSGMDVKTRNDSEHPWQMQMKDKPLTDRENAWLMRVEEKPCTGRDNAWLMRVENKPSTDPDNKWLMRVEDKPCEARTDPKDKKGAENKYTFSEVSVVNDSSLTFSGYSSNSLDMHQDPPKRICESCSWLSFEEEPTGPENFPGVDNFLFTKTLFRQFWCFNYSINKEHQRHAIQALGGDWNTKEVKKQFYDKLKLIQGLNIPVHEHKIVLSFEDSDVVEAMYKAGLLVNPKEFILNKSHLFSKREQQAISKRTTQALKFIRQADSFLFESMLQVVACIGYYKAAEKGHLGGTVSSAVGLIWLDPSKGGDWSIPFLAEQIVHEYIHTTLFIAEMVRGTYTDTSLVPESLVVSAIRRQKRGYDKSFHAAYVASGLVAFHANTGSIGRASELAKYLNQSVLDLEKVQRETGVLDENGAGMLLHLKTFLHKAKIM